MTRAAVATAVALSPEPGGKGAEQPGVAAASHLALTPAPLPRRRRGRHPLGSRASARIRATSLAHLLAALAPSRGPVVHFTVRMKDGSLRRARFSHASVLFHLRRAIAEAQTVNAAHAEPPLPAWQPSPAASPSLDLTATA